MPSSYLYTQGDHMDRTIYNIENAEQVETPALVYFEDIIVENTRKALARAGGPSRFWPHVKSHKMEAMIRMQQGMGIERFKCATIAEAQMVAECGAGHIVLSYPLVGPNIARFLKLQRSFPKTQFYAIGDNEGQLALLAAASQAEGAETQVLIDVNMGMNRTGMALSGVKALYARCAQLQGIRPVGLHCYDGHVGHPDLAARAEIARESQKCVYAIRDALQAEGLPCDILIMGGTPTFPVHAPSPDVYLSPGTVFLGDAKCLRNVRELDIVPAAGILTRVISHPAPGLFTLDLGSKGISTDQPDGRGVVVGLEEAKPLFQSEEHWVYEMPEGKAPPPIGAMFFVIPMHVCPATALYPFAHVVSGGRITQRWQVTARDRNLGI